MNLKTVLLVKYCTEIAVMVVFGGVLVMVGINLNKTLTTTNSAMGQLNNTFEYVNRPHSGILAIVSEVANSLKVTVGKSNIILDHEQRQLTKWDTQEQEIFENIAKITANTADIAKSAQGATTHLTTDLETANTTLNDLNKSLDKVPTTMDTLNKTIGDADDLVKDAELKRILKEVGNTATNVDSISEHSANITAHFDKEINNPKKLSILDKILIWFK